ncbi:acetoacetate--CoA ligase [Gordonia rhizosphera]|uniref:Acetoacetyl-CoA synthetase n=1 Tax=Gordonia rhizosphera NBRC 16068 TaxID=1108045 RepID=K6W3S4_9ACTN|nr:acetoacetate--CoA ligase [Gordonia rhizosphera]GAB93785.1 acetoacetyl-CoA synthetase [Gordonia rhizosphera NBRC 16068]
MTVHQESVSEICAPIWAPDPAATATTQITEFTALISARTGETYPGYRDLWRYSVGRPADFWSAVVDYFDVMVDDVPVDVLPSTAMPGARWFPDARINYAEHALRHSGPDAAIIGIDEHRSMTEVSWDTLRGHVGALQRWLRARGVGRGDRVVGYLPNTVHAVVGLLATTGIGAVWAVCGQDYGAAGAQARLGQLEPTVLLAADGYRWNGTEHDRRDEVSRLRDAMPTVRAVLRVPVLDRWADADAPAGEAEWAEVVAESVEPEFVRVEFNDPLWVLFSSGTTGVPKGIVHSHGGVVIDHFKVMGLHNDLRRGDRFFWYTTTNWMMWNMVASGLLVGATVVLYDGSPGYPGPQRLWEIAADHRVSVLGVSPGYLAAGAAAGLHPATQFDLSALRAIACTGAPLPAQSYHWIHDEVGAHIQVASTSGGTDVVSGFAGCAPTTPVWPGEISAPLLGVDLQAWGADGRAVVDEVGELVIATPMPSMPIGFWHDPDGTRYREAYFDTFPGVWRHGDWITVTERGSVIISGRSDATLNRQGVRLGSADIYDAVETLPEIREALVIGAELGESRYWMPLFVVLVDGSVLDDALRARIVAAIRSEASPRHVPDDIITVPAIPHTRTGKKLEVPVKRLIQGRPLGQVTGVDTVDDPDALQYFARFAKGFGGSDA